jgi:glycosyltransferase involved in cell wall biosynthesis
VKVLLTATSLLPDYGGPAFSVSRLAIALAEAGAEVGLWAFDRSAAITPLLPTESSVRRLTGREAEALDGFGKVDVLHDSGIWRPHNHRLAELAMRRGIPRVVSTRGMLEPWAMNHKRWKKSLAWWAYQRRDLKRARCHHTTAEMEAQHVRQLALGVPVRMIPNGVDVPHQLLKLEALKRGGGRKVALFLSRIHPKKGLPMLIEAWGRVRPENWHLNIAGPDEAGHGGQVEEAVLAAGLSRVVSFVGPVQGEMKNSIFSNADLFVLPTHSENFGIVVAEALARAVPVLTTTAAPWSKLQPRGCGWSVTPTVDGIVTGLREATSCSLETLRAMGARGRAWVLAEFGWDGVAREILALYDAAIAGP